MLSISINQSGTAQRAFLTLPFAIFPGAATPDVWDFTNATLEKDAASGVPDRERALCLLSQGKMDESRAWFRRALYEPLG